MIFKIIITHILFYLVNNYIARRFTIAPLHDAIIKVKKVFENTLKLCYRQNKAQRKLTVKHRLFIFAQL